MKTPKSCRQSATLSSISKSAPSSSKVLAVDASTANTLLLLGALFDILDNVADCLQLFGVFIRDFDRKFFLKCHYQFDDIQRIRAQILNEGRLWRDLLRVDAQLLDNNVLNFLFDRFFRHKICSVCVGRAWKSSGGCRTFPSTAWQ